MTLRKSLKKLSAFVNDHIPFIVFVGSISAGIMALGGTIISHGMDIKSLKKDIAAIKEQQELNAEQQKKRMDVLKSSFTDQLDSLTNNFTSQMETQKSCFATQLETQKYCFAAKLDVLKLHNFAAAEKRGEAKFQKQLLDMGFTSIYKDHRDAAPQCNRKEK
jgi:hypothetical protein